MAPILRLGLLVIVVGGLVVGLIFAIAVNIGGSPDNRKVTPATIAKVHLGDSKKEVKSVLGTPEYGIRYPRRETDCWVYKLKRPQPRAGSKQVRFCFSHGKLASKPSR